MSDGNRTQLTRRKVLTSVGITAAGGFSGIGAGRSKINKTMEGDVEGICYDTLTHQVGSVVNGHLKRGTKGLEGSLEVSGFTIDINDLNRRETDRRDPAIERYGADLQKKTYGPENIPGSDEYQDFLRQKRKDKDKALLPLRVRIVEHDNHIAGIISRPSTRFGELGFYALSKKNINVGETIESKSADPKWVESNISFEVPGSGLPIDSSTKHLREYKNRRENPEVSNYE